MATYRVTTPQFSFTLPIDTSDCSVIQITYTQGAHKLVKEYSHGTLPPGMILDEDTVINNLTQQETKDFKAGTVDVQLRALSTGGQAYASDHFIINVIDVNNEDILQ